MPKLMIILGSVREGRVGLPIAEWVREAAEADGRFEIDFVDLKELALPFMSEPNHPSMQQYTQPHTIAWAERVASADAYIFAFPEYNNSFSPAIKNAIDYLVKEWDRKPVAFVNWGGNSNGTRAQAALRPVVTMLGMVMTHGLLEINTPQARVEDGRFTPEEQHEQVLASILDELLQLDGALAPLRG